MSSNLTVTVVDVNKEPEIVNLPNTTSVYDGSTGGDIVFVVSSTDQENDALTYSISASYPNGAPFSVNDSGKFVSKILVVILQLWFLYI